MRWLKLLWRKKPDTTAWHTTVQFFNGPVYSTETGLLITDLIIMQRKVHGHWQYRKLTEQERELYLQHVY